MSKRLAKNFFRVPLIGGTVTHPVQGEAAAGVVMLRPASPGTGVIAGGAVRAVLECAGVHDVLARASAPTTRSTSSTPPLRLSRCCSVPKRSRPVVASRSKMWHRPVCSAPGPARKRKTNGRTEDHPGQGHHRYQKNQRDSLRTLGLKGIRKTVTREDTRRTAA